MFNAAKSCGSCSYYWRFTSNTYSYVFVWNISHGTLSHIFTHTYSFTFCLYLINGQLAQFFGAEISEGIFVGCFLSMSSTAVVCYPIFYFPTIFPVFLVQTKNVFIDFPLFRLWNFWLRKIAIMLFMVKSLLGLSFSR